MTLAINYVGDQSHFLAPSGGNIRGYWNDQMDPKYLVLGSLLIMAATTTNIQKAQQIIPGISVLTFFENVANQNPTSSPLTLGEGAHRILPVQRSDRTPWAWNSAKLHVSLVTDHSLLQRMSHGLTFNINYTYSKNIGDDGSFRSGFDIPAAVLSGGGQSWHQDRIDRSWTTTSVPENLHAFGVWNLPFGKGHLGGNNWAGRNLAGGWQLSGIYTYSSGSPMAVTSNLCTATNFPNQGQCMPDVLPGATSARIKWQVSTPDPRGPQPAI